MATELKRMTFAITPDVEVRLDEMKRKMFYNCSRSEMVRKLLEAGADAIDKREETNEKTATA